MIDPASGALVLIGGRLEVGTPRSEVLAMPCGHDARVGKRFKRSDIEDLVLVPQAMGAHAFDVRLEFPRQHDTLSGYMLRERFRNEGFEPVESEAPEIARRAAHDAWLRETLERDGEVIDARHGPALRFAFEWGVVWSFYSLTMEMAGIVVRFGDFATTSFRPDRDVMH